MSDKINNSEDTSDDSEKIKITEWAKEYVLNPTNATDEKIVKEVDTYLQDIVKPKNFNAEHNRILSEIKKIKKDLQIKEKETEHERLPPMSIEAAEAKYPIPEQLQNPDFRFVLLGKWNEWTNVHTKEKKIFTPEEYKSIDTKTWKPEGKKPQEYDWQHNGLRFNDKKVHNHIINLGLNFGIIGGYGELRIIDIDNPELAEKLESCFETFTVKTGSGGRHFYILSDYEKNHVLVNELGEIRALNYQVVAPPCKHPSGNQYEVIKNIPIKRINKDELLSILEPYLRKDKGDKGENEEKDTSRSGTEYRRIIALLRKGHIRKDIYEIMSRDTGSKWYSAPEQYRTRTFEKAQEFVSEEIKEDREKAKNQNYSIDERENKRTTILLPGKGRLDTVFIRELANVLEKRKVLFYRMDTRTIVEILKSNKGATMIEETPERFVTLAERFVIPGNMVKDEETGESTFVERSMTPAQTKIFLCSPLLQDILPCIERIFTVPFPMLYNDELTFPKVGYDERFNSWMSSTAPKISNPDMTVEEAKKTFYDIFKEFPFLDKQDYINALAGLVTPFCRGLYPKFNTRVPCWCYKANKSKLGKDFCAGLTGITYQGINIEEPAISSINADELRKKILGYFNAGTQRIHFANNTGFLRNDVFEEIITAEVYRDRLLGKNTTVEYPNELYFSLSANTGFSWSKDLDNRMLLVELFSPSENANSRIYNNPNLHNWAAKHRDLILSAIFALIRNWHEKGQPSSSVPFTSFPDWARVVGGIFDAAELGNPCNKKEFLDIGGDTETSDMKSFFECAYTKFPEQIITHKELKQIAIDEDLFGYLDFAIKKDQTAFGMKIRKNIGVEYSGIYLIVKDKKLKMTRQEFTFTKNPTNIPQTKDVFYEIVSPILSTCPPLSTHPPRANIISDVYTPSHISLQYDYREKGVQGVLGGQIPSKSVSTSLSTSSCPPLKKKAKKDKPSQHFMSSDRELQYFESPETENIKLKCDKNLVFEFLKQNPGTTKKVAYSILGDGFYTFFNDLLKQGIVELKDNKIFVK